MDFDYLERNQGFSLYILHTDTGSEDLKIDGTIIEAKNIQNLYPPPRIFRIISVMIYTFIYSLSITILGYFFKSKDVLIIFSMIFLPLYSIFRIFFIKFQYRVPKKLKDIFRFSPLVDINVVKKLEIDKWKVNQ